jgi:uncharacterized protein (DUF885 family)
MRSLLVFGLMSWIALHGSPLRAADGENEEDAKLTSFFRSYLDEFFRAEPVRATQLGDHRFDDRLDDLSVQARDSWIERDRRALSKLPEQVAYGKLSRSGQIDFEILTHHLVRQIWLAEQFKPYEEDPRIYGDYLTESVYLLLTQSSLPKATNFKNALARMAEIPKVVDVARKTIGNPPQVKLNTAILQTKGAIGFYSDELFSLAGEPVGQGDLGEKARAIVAALESYLSFLQDEVMPRSTDGWRIGAKAFAHKLELELDAGLSADEVLKEAEGEADRVERDMYVIARQMWGTAIPDEPLPPDDRAGRGDTIRQVLATVAKDHGTSETLVADARATVASIKEFITRRKILRLPDPDRCQIIEMPEFMRGNSVAYLNPSPPLDPQAVSVYAISPPPALWDAARVTSFLEEYNHAMLKILTIHEGYPGHYVALEYSNRCPSLIRRVLSSGTFDEGWAVYTEQMMLDQGFGSGDLGLRLQQLKFYLRTVINAILDNRMHAGTLTDDETKALLIDRAFQTEGEALGKIIRSKQTSCQLSTYFVGRTAFSRLRQVIEREQGSRFHLDRYHEAVLAHGNLPVKYLPELVRETLSQKSE